MSTSLAQIQAKLDRWELDHLRDLASRQAEELDELRRRLNYAEECAEHWRENAMQLHNELCDVVGGSPGLTQDGTLVVAGALT